MLQAPCWGLAVVILHARCVRGAYLCSLSQRNADLRQHLVGQLRVGGALGAHHSQISQVSFHICAQHPPARRSNGLNVSTLLDSCFGYLAMTTDLPSQWGQPQIRQALSEGFGHFGNQIIRGAFSNATPTWVHVSVHPSELMLRLFLGTRQALSEGFGHFGNQMFLWRFGFEVLGNGARPCRAGVR